MRALALPPVLLLTRPRDQAEGFARAAVAALGPLRVVIAPLVEIMPRPLEADPAGFATLVFTSENGVRQFAAQSGLRDRPAWCVGPRTAAVAAEAGFAVQPLAPGGDAEALIAALRAARPALPILHLRGAQVVTDLAGRLTAEGLACAEAVVYAQSDVSPSAEALEVLAGPAPVLLPIFSPLAAARAAAMLRGAPPGGAGGVAVAISPAAARRWRAVAAEGGGAGWTVAVAPSPDAAGMMEALRGALRRLAA